MTEPVGLSVGATNLVAAFGRGDSVVRESVMTVFADRAPVVGLSRQRVDGGEPGVELTGFVDRVGDPVGIVGAGGFGHRAESLLAQALRALLHDAVGADANVSLAASVPAHWGPPTVRALRDAVAELPELSFEGQPLPLLSDAHTTLTAMAAEPGLPDEGVVALCDLGGTGTSISLADAANDFEPIGDTVRHWAFSGDEIDQLLLTQILIDNETADVDPTGTATITALTGLRALCRAAKERLSVNTVTTVRADLPGFRADVRLTRAELEGHIRDPLADLVAAMHSAIERAGLHPSKIAAVATAGGGAAIPLVAQVLSEAFRAPVVRAAQPQLVAAVGAAAGAIRERAGAAATTMAPVAALGSGDAVAWSVDDTSPEVLPLVESVDGDADGDAARPDLVFEHDQADEEERRRQSALVPWYRRPGVLLAAAAIAASASAGGLYLTTVRPASTDVPAIPAPVSTTTVPPAVPQQAPAVPAPAPVLQAPAPGRAPAPAPVVRAPAPPVPRQQAPAPRVPVRQAPAPQPPMQQPAPAAPAEPPAELPALAPPPGGEQWQPGDPIPGLPTLPTIPPPSLPPIPGFTDRPDIPGPFQ